MKIKILTLLTFMLLGLSLETSASEVLTSPDLKELESKALELGRKYGNDHVLVVYDMDNTLLAMNQDLGSDQWFDWQSSLLSQGNNPNQAASDIGALLGLQQKLFMLSGMHLTQAETPEIVARLHDQGFSEFILSSRGPEMRDSSLRELKKNKLSFDWSSDLVKKTKTYLPYTLEAPEADCLSLDDIRNLKLGAPRSVSYGAGIMLTSGQHKGAMLRSLLCKTGSHFKAIIFVDDKQKNVDAVQAAYQNSNIDLVTYRYSEEDQRVTSFHSGNKAQAKTDWNLLKSALTQIFSN